MNLAVGSGFSTTEWNSPQTRKVILSVLILVLASLLFYNFMLAPELKLKKQLATRILQTDASLNKVKSAGTTFKQENSFQSLQDRESVLRQLLPAEWQRAELLHWLTNTMQKNGLQLEEQSFEENNAQTLLQTLKINLKLSGEYASFLRFMQELKDGPRLLLLEKLLLVNPTPAQQEPELRIEMVLAVYKSLQIPLKENNL
ncbi:MAG: type 4a pilus biogenesis protein PilO [SAR324 cluster bacterium]|jgi:Tfp pilus assembly protein PilO|nr:type 4a pilus biogenesis protein PilO [SAR324 cluster bacterium]|tara:strand:+ start:10037 stop:10639 length:603 start_codon:yes stop_codon:yes gene_type:complete